MSLDDWKNVSDKQVIENSRDGKPIEYNPNMIQEIRESARKELKRRGYSDSQIREYSKPRDW